MGFSLCVYLSSQPASQNQLLMFRYFNLCISYEPVYVISLMFWFWIWTSLMVNFTFVIVNQISANRGPVSSHVNETWSWFLWSKSRWWSKIWYFSHPPRPVGKYLCQKSRMVATFVWRKPGSSHIMKCSLLILIFIV